MSVPVMSFNRLVSQCMLGLFTLLSKCFPPVPEALEPATFRKILVFSAAGIGDTLTDSTAIRALKETYPQAEIHVVTHRRRQEIVRHNPAVDHVILYHKSIFRFFSLLSTLRSLQPDVIVMLRGNDPDLWPLAYLTRRGRVVSCPIMTRFQCLIPHLVEIPDWDQLHGVEQTLQIVRYIGADTQDRRLVYCVREDECEALRKKLAEMGATYKPFIVFQVGGGARSSWRDWPLERFSELGQKLLESYDVELILLGGADQIEKADAIRSRIKGRVTNLAGRFSLSESAALLSLSKILVSTDTGIMHLGFAVNVDTLALIHCNNPASRVGPYQYDDKHLVVELTAPPGEKASKSINMSLITLNEVWPKLQNLCERNKIKSVK
jgi:ADP-heptose:LPS heptosyltransferase